jgi:hypothetical protein
MKIFRKIYQKSPAAFATGQLKESLSQVSYKYRKDIQKIEKALLLGVDFWVYFLRCQKKCLILPTE